VLPNRTSGERDANQPQARDQTGPSLPNVTNTLNSGEAEQCVPDFITSFLHEKCPDSGPIGADEDLVLTGVLNSMHFVELLYLIEAELDTEISLDDVSTDDFRTIENIRARFFPEAPEAPKAA
jgi:acyl carrier protein